MTDIKLVLLRYQGFQILTRLLQSFLESRQADVAHLYNYIKRLRAEFFGERKVQLKAHSFLNRIEKLSEGFQLGDLVQTVPALHKLHEQIVEELKQESIPLKMAQSQWRADYIVNTRILPRAQDELERRRVIANVLGLIIVASVKMAWGNCHPPSIPTPG